MGSDNSLPNPTNKTKTFKSMKSTPKFLLMKLNAKQNVRSYFSTNQLSMFAKNLKNIPESHKIPSGSTLQLIKVNFIKIKEATMDTPCEIEDEDISKSNSSNEKITKHDDFNDISTAPLTNSSHLSHGKYFSRNRLGTSPEPKDNLDTGSEKRWNKFQIRKKTDKQIMKALYVQKNLMLALME